MLLRYCVGPAALSEGSAALKAAPASLMGAVAPAALKGATTEPRGGHAILKEAYIPQKPVPNGFEGGPQRRRQLRQ